MSLSTATGHYDYIKTGRVSRSRFNLSCSTLTTIDVDYLYPIKVLPCYPSDTFKFNLSMFGRTSTPIKPSMDDVKLQIDAFFVPMRLVWVNYNRFFGEQDSPGDSIDYTIPQILPDFNSGFPEGSIFDYMGLPVNAGSSNVHVPISALPARAYHCIYNDWYRNQNLIPMEDEIDGDTPTKHTAYKLLKKRKKLDYLTSCLPRPQKGDPVNLVPGGSFPVKGGTVASDGTPLILGSNTPGSAIELTGNLTGGTGASVEGAEIPDPSVGFRQGGRFISGLSFGGATVDFGSGSLTVNDFRNAIQVQQVLELSARAGTRYAEIVSSHFDVTPLDARLDRTEFLGTFSSHLNFSSVPQQSATDRTSPQGNLSAFGTVGASRDGVVHYSCPEHGFIMFIAYTEANNNYQQGVERWWSALNRFDFMLPSFCHLGEMPVYNREVFLSGSTMDSEVFGYQERFADLKTPRNTITGKMRSTAALSLDVWHYAQKFDNLPTLNQQFIEQNTPFARNLAVQNEPHIFLNVDFGILAVRCMPVWGTPGGFNNF